jgi:hypothetical protein
MGTRQSAFGLHKILGISLSSFYCMGLVKGYGAVRYCPLRDCRRTERSFHGSQRMIALARTLWQPTLYSQISGLFGNNGTEVVGNGRGQFLNTPGILL